MGRGLGEFFPALALAAWGLASPGPARAAGSSKSVPAQPVGVKASAVIDFAELAARQAKEPALATSPRAVHAFMPIPHDLRPTGMIGSRVLAPAAKAPTLPFVGAAGPLSPPAASSFPALDDNNSRIPPDTHGAVGPNHLMVTLNSEVRIQDRSGGQISRVTLESFWAAVNVAGGSFVFDPKVTFDPFAGRWIFTACDDDGLATSAVLIGVSLTDDPTGSWNLRRVGADPIQNRALWADYPSLGFNKDWIAVQVNIYANADDTFFNSHVFVFDKASLYAGGTGAPKLAELTGEGATHVPAYTYDNTLAALYLVTTANGNFSGNGLLRVYSITGPVAAPVLNFGPFVTVPGPWSQEAFNGDDFARQLGSPRKIQTNDDRMQNVVYRNGRLWATHGIFLPSGGNPQRASVQWVQLDPAVANFGLPVQLGRIDDPTNTLFYGFPSIAVNANEEVLVGHNRFGAAQYASANYSFRAPTDPPGTLQADVVLKAGLAKYDKDFGGGLNRWGDYSNTVSDPLYTCDMWTIQEYAELFSGGFDRWGTWWGRVAGTPRITINDVSVTEGNSGTTTATFTVSLSCSSGQTVKVDWATANDSATTADGDYASGSGTLTFLAGETSKAVTVIVNGDFKRESDERFFVNLGNPVLAVVLDGQGEGTILNDDPLPSISIGDVSVTEGDSGTTPASFSVTLSNPSSVTVTVGYDTADSSAVAPGDYASQLAGVVTFLPGVVSQTVTVLVNGDVLVEGDEAFKVLLSGPANASVLDGEGIATIVDDDVPAGGGLVFFTATSTDFQNFLEWRTPSGTAVGTVIRYNQSTLGTSDCTFPGSAAAGSPVPGVPSYAPDANQTVPHQPLQLNTAYCYAAWVETSTGVFSAVRTVKARPFSTAGKVKWAYSTGAAAVAPPGAGSAVFAVSNDRVLHAMVRGSGGTAGRWPGSFTPFAMNGPAQTRPPVLPGAVLPPSAEVTFLGSEDGHVYAVDTTSGAQRWPSPLLGEAVQAGAAALLTAFGGAYNYVLVGTWNSVADNRFYALNVTTGATVGPPFDNGGGAASIGVISGTAAVDYPTSRVYFASRARGSSGTLWCLTLTAGGIGGICPGGGWPVALGDIDASPTLRGGKVYVGNTVGKVFAVDATTGALVWTFDEPFVLGDGGAKGFIFPDRGSTDLFFSTTGRIWSISDLGSSVAKNWDTTLGGAVTPSIPLFNPGTKLLYVGGSDGSLYQLDFSLANLATPPVPTPLPLGDGSALVGAPTLHRLDNFIYVGSLAGVIFAVELPL